MSDPNLYVFEFGREKALAEEGEERVGLVGVALEANVEIDGDFGLNPLGFAEQQEGLRGEQKLRGAAIEFAKIYESIRANACTSLAADLLSLLVELRFIHRSTDLPASI